MEAIQIHGIDCYYIARDLVAYDPIYGTDPSSRYERTWLIEVYLENVLGFQGDREFMSKFAGLEIRDQVTFAMSKTRFEQEIAEELGASRPREGDLLYFHHLHDRCYQIKFVEHHELLYPLGEIYFYTLTCELFEYSGEAFNTGIAVIDHIQREGSINILDYLLYDTDGAPLMTENLDYITTEKYDLDKIVPLSDNIDVDTEDQTKGYIDWDATRPFGEPTSDDSGSHRI